MHDIPFFIEKLKNTSIILPFQETILFIDTNYRFTPTAFQNGKQNNKAGENNGSCKVFSFAKLHDLTENETLLLFGEHYQDVINSPNGNNHANIRNFMEFGWSGITFEGDALELI